jgi:hypothetical protein
MMAASKKFQFRNSEKIPKKISEKISGDCCRNAMRMYVGRHRRCVEIMARGQFFKGRLGVNFAPGRQLRAWAPTSRPGANFSRKRQLHGTNFNRLRNCWPEVI